MPLSRDDKKKLKKLKIPKYNPIKCIENKELFTIKKNENMEATLTIEYQSSIKQQLNDALALFHENMGHMYQKSSWGLDMNEKKEELEHLDARFLTVFSSSNRDLVAFLHYRFDTDDDDDPTRLVLYVFELQVSEKYQRRYGIGRRLMEIVELIAKGAFVNTVMLTVFSDNVKAVKFYKNKVGYMVDAISPEEEDYELLSKIV